MVDTALCVCGDIGYVIVCFAVERVVQPDENLCLLVDFWGKMRVGDEQT